MMSHDTQKPNGEKENSPFRSAETPPSNVSGVPENYVLIDLSRHDAPDEAKKSAPEPAVTPEKAPEAPAEAAEPKRDATVEVVGIRFKKGGKIYYFDPHRITANKGDYAIVETARGQEYGEIALGNTRVPEKEIVPPIRPVLRIATKADAEHYEENRRREDDAFRICLEKIEAHKLDMKLVEAQYTFDNSKLLFYFTSSGRVDFRELVKDLASVFRTRIELRQIGIRDEAKLIGGLGSCGRPLCCSGFLSDFGQVSIKMAKEQNLSLNSTKISGTCGRLMCCLRYEYETYLEEIRLTPPVNSVVMTPDGVGTITETSPIAGTVKVRLRAEPDAAPRPYHRDTITVFPKGTEPTEAELAVRARKKDDFSERLAAFESALSSSAPTSRRTEGEAPARREARQAHRRDEARPASQPQRRAEGGNHREKPASEGGAPARARHSAHHHRRHPQGHAKKPSSAQKPQHRSSGGRSGS